MGSEQSSPRMQMATIYTAASHTQPTEIPLGYVQVYSGRNQFLIFDNNQLRPV